MTFYDPARKERYSYTRSEDERGWILVWRHAAVVAGGEAGHAQRVLLLAGVGGGDCGRAADVFYLHFDDKFPDEKRIDQVIAWLKLPAEQRPHFITLYYSNVDHAGHEYGPDSAADGSGGEACG